MLAYERLAKTVRFLAAWRVLPLSQAAIDIARRLRNVKPRIRIRTNDLYIAAITLEHGATLVSRNLSSACRDCRWKTGRCEVEEPMGKFVGAANLMFLLAISGSGDDSSAKPPSFRELIVGRWVMELPIEVAKAQPDLEVVFDYKVDGSFVVDNGGPTVVKGKYGFISETEFEIEIKFAGIQVSKKEKIKIEKLTKDYMIATDSKSTSRFKRQPPPRELILGHWLSKDGKNLRTEYRQDGTATISAAGVEIAGKYSLPAEDQLVIELDVPGKGKVTQKFQVKISSRILTTTDEKAKVEQFTRAKPMPAAKRPNPGKIDPLILGKWTPADESGKGRVTMEFQEDGTLVLTTGTAIAKGYFRFLDADTIELGIPNPDGIKPRTTKIMATKDELVFVSDKSVKWIKAK